MPSSTERFAFIVCHLFLVSVFALAAFAMGYGSW